MTLTTFRLYIKVINNLVFMEDEDHVYHKTYRSTKSKRHIPENKVHTATNRYIKTKFHRKTFCQQRPIVKCSATLTL